MKTKKTERTGTAVSDFGNVFEKTREGRERIDQLHRVLQHIRGPGRGHQIKVPDVELRVGIFSCPHFGSLYAHTKALGAFYSECAKAKTTHIFCCGDVCDGHRMYKGQEFEQRSIGWEAQAEEFTSLAPQTQINTWFISGNHDESLKKLAGVNPGKDLSRRRPDWIYMGESYGRITLEAGGKRNCIIDLLHPSGGSAYALSYRPQRIVEQIEGGTKPDLLCIGHFHKAEFIPSYRNIAVLQAGTFQTQTPYMMAKGLSAHVGGWIVDVGIGKSCNSFAVKFFAFY